jgi:hypothetical protein
MIGMAKRIARTIIKGQKGQVLPIVLVLLAMGGLLVAPTLQYASTSLKGHRVIERNVLEIYAADSGVEDALHWLVVGREVQGPWDDWNEVAGFGERDPYYINDRVVDVTVERMEVMGPNMYEITSAASSADGSTTVVCAVWAIPFFEDGTVFTNADPPPPGDFHVDGDGIVGNLASITGDVTVSGNLTLENGAIITGNVYVEGDITITNGAVVTGTLCLGGGGTLGNSAMIEGDIYVSGNSTIRLEEVGSFGNVYVDGDAYIYLGGPQSYMGGDGIYASGNIYVMEAKGTFDYGIIEEEYVGEPPFPQPECPVVPLNPVEIFSWTIT